MPEFNRDRFPYSYHFDQTIGVDFSAYHAACAWLKKRGFSYGSLQRGAPTAIYKDDSSVAEWRNLSKKDRDAMDGVMLTPTGEYRNGPVVVLLRESTP
jgi:hypothetical protein